MNVLKALFMLFILLLFLASCLPTTQAALPVESPNQPAGAAALPPQDAPLLPPPAALKAAQAMAGQLGLPAGQVTITLIEEAEWPDGCLGLGGPAESCLQEVVPGYRVLVKAGDVHKEYRTDREGAVVREAQPAQ